MFKLFLMKKRDESSYCLIVDDLFQKEVALLKAKKPNPPKDHGFKKRHARLQRVGESLVSSRLFSGDVRFKSI